VLGLFVKENGRGFERSDNLSSEILYSCTRFYGLRKGMKCQRIAGVDVEVRTLTFLLYRTYDYFDLRNSFVILLYLFHAVQSHYL